MQRGRVSCALEAHLPTDLLRVSAKVCIAVGAPMVVMLLRG